MRAVVATAFALWLTACASGPVLDPSGIPGAPRDDLTLLAIRRACAVVGFTIQEEVPGRVRARVARHEWMLEVDVLYGGPTVSIRYANSNELGYWVGKDGRPHIRSSYNDWVMRLADAIQRNAKLVAADVDPDSQLGPPVAEPAKSAD
ncbi:MAG TPA: hypothetical protein VMR86_16290 [Myxococcota bacterium]|nr:hypothetical protein [Myxococcota bacterium]